MILNNLDSISSLVSKKETFSLLSFDPRTLTRAKLATSNEKINDDIKELPISTAS